MRVEVATSSLLPLFPDNAKFKHVNKLDGCTELYGCYSTFASLCCKPLVVFCPFSWFPARIHLVGSFSQPKESQMHPFLIWHSAEKIEKMSKLSMWAHFTTGTPVQSTVGCKTALRNGGRKRQRQHNLAKNTFF